MKSIRYLGVAVLAGALQMAALPAVAELTGNVTATSEYIFRGITSSNGAAVQGGMDYTHDSGLYAGFWGSNVAPLLADANELDLYVGFAPTLNDLLSLDFGVLYYVFSEDEQQDTVTNAGGMAVPAGDTDSDFFEVYAGVTIQNLAIYAWYADDFLAVDDRSGADGEAIYLQADYALPLTEKLSLGLHLGTQMGDGADAVFDGPDSDSDGEYVDYAISLNADIGDGWGASFGIAATDLEDGDGGFSDQDEPKYYVAISKSFSIIE